MILVSLLLSMLMLQNPARPAQPQPQPVQPAVDPVPQETMPTLDKLKTDYADCSVTLNSKLFYIEVLKKTIRDQAAEIAELKKSKPSPIPSTKP